ncbi:type II toxin-antitoxin system YafQ family toxin [Patescibacteria group bacterium]
MYRLVLSSAFQRQLKRLVKRNPRLKGKIKKIFEYLIKNVNHSSLKLHKLSGKNNWSISVTHDIRIIIHLEGDQIFCLRIGSHDQVY